MTRRCISFGCVHIVVRVEERPPRRMLLICFGVLRVAGNDCVNESLIVLRVAQERLRRRRMALLLGVQRVGPSIAGMKRS